MSLADCLSSPKEELLPSLLIFPHVHIHSCIYALTHVFRRSLFSTFSASCTVFVAKVDLDWSPTKCQPLLWVIYKHHFSNLCESFESRGFSPAGTTRGSPRVSKHKKDLTCCCWLKDVAEHVTQHTGVLQELRVAPTWQPARKWGPQSHSYREINSAILSIWMSLKADSLPGPPVRSSIQITPWFWPCISTEPNWAHLDVSPSDCDIISGYYFKLSLWYLLCRSRKPLQLSLLLLLIDSFHSHNKPVSCILFSLDYRSRNWNSEKWRYLLKPTQFVREAEIHSHSGLLSTMLMSVDRSTGPQKSLGWV